jgi:DNA polymerase III alpha subunit (gram-positive type)
MIVLAYDLESTGLDKQNDRMIEVGLVLFSTGQNKILESAGFLVKSDGVPIRPEITELTHITPEALDRFGYEPRTAMETIQDFAAEADAILGHNINRFDMPVTNNTTKRLAFPAINKLQIDTMVDLPYGVKGEQLITLCAKKGFVNPHQHSAEDDAKATLKLVCEWGIDAAIERARVPLVLIRSHQARDDDSNKQARKAGFVWNNPHKIWWKVVKVTDVDKIRASVPFEVSEVDKAITIESVQD